MDNLNRRKQIVTGISLLVMGLVTACSDSAGKNANPVSSNMIASTIAFDEPPRILSGRAIDSSLLRVRVIVNGTTYGLDRNGSSWSGDVMVPQGNYLNLQVVWLQDDLELASYTTSYGFINQNTTISVSPDLYNSTQYDLDADGLDNLSELRNNTSPWDNTSPGINNSIATELVDDFPSTADFDHDGVADPMDNCRSVSNTFQADVDGDGVGDICDPNNTASPVSEILENYIDAQVRLTKDIEINAISPQDPPGGTYVGVTIYVGEYWNTSTQRDFTTELIDENGRVYKGQTSTNTSASFDAGADIYYSTGFSVYGPSRQYRVRLSERVPGEPDSTIRLTEPSSDANSNPLEFSVDVGTIHLASPIQVEQTTNEQGTTKFEFVFSVEERSGHSVSAKIFAEVRADNGRSYTPLSNSDVWDESKATTVFAPYQRVQYRLPIESDSDGEALRAGTYSVHVGAWNYTQINPDEYAGFGFLDLDPSNEQGDKISFVLR